jgi:hypothetical protein
LVQGLTDTCESSGETREARLLLYALDAIITLQLAEEEELAPNCGSGECSRGDGPKYL